MTIAWLCHFKNYEIHIGPLINIIIFDDEEDICTHFNQQGN